MNVRECVGYKLKGKIKKVKELPPMKFVEEDVIIDGMTREEVVSTNVERLEKKMKKMYSVYCAHQISGLTYEEVKNYYTRIKDTLSKLGFHVLHPMTGKNEIRTEVSTHFKPEGYKTKLATNHAIFERDQWMVRNCDILYLDLNMEKVSIGCMMELAWASLLGKYTVVVMPKGNPHEHAFVYEAADVVFETEEEALGYLKKFVNQDI